MLLSTPTSQDNKLVNKRDRGGAFALSPSDDVIDLSLDYLECTFCDDITCQPLLSIHFSHAGHESVDVESFYPTHRADRRPWTKFMSKMFVGGWVVVRGVSRVGLGLHAEKVLHASRHPSIEFEPLTSGVSQF